MGTGNFIVSLSAMIQWIYSDLFCILGKIRWQIRVEQHIQWFIQNLGYAKKTKQNNKPPPKKNQTKKIIEKIVKYL